MSPSLQRVLTPIQITLRGLGQVMFQGHAVTGLLFFLGMVVASWEMAVGALLGMIIGPITARLLKYNSAEVNDGIYGFNSSLVGIACMFYLDPGNPLEWVFLVGGCILSTVMTYAMRRWLKFPTYTAPFIVSTWVVLFIAHGVVGKSIDHKPIPRDTNFLPESFTGKVLAGNAEVMFGRNIVTGFLFVVGIAVSSWRHASLYYIGSVIGTLIAYYHQDPETSVTLGLFGYNAALAAIAVYLWRKSILYPILAAIISVPLTEFFPSSLGIHALTAPFCVASWIVIVMGYFEKWFCTD